MIFDLDPDEGLEFGDVKRAASDIRAQLADLGLVSFAMLSGGKGVYVVVPLTSGQDWNMVETRHDCRTLISGTWMVPRGGRQALLERPCASGCCLTILKCSA